MKRKIRKQKKFNNNINFKGNAMASAIIIILGILMTIGIFTAKNNLNQNPSQNNLIPSITVPSINIPSIVIPSGDINQQQNINISNNSSTACINGKCYTCSSASPSQGAGDTQINIVNNSCTVVCNNDKCTCNDGECTEISPSP